ACGKRPHTPPTAEAWWVSAAREQKKPVITPLTPPEPTVSPEPKKSKTVPTGVIPPPSPPLPRRVASVQTRLPVRGVSVGDDDDDEPPTWIERLRSLDFGSALAFLCFSVALLFNSFAQLDSWIKLIAAIGLLAGLLGGVLPALWQTRNAVLPVLLSILCLLVLLFVGSWPRWSSSPPPPLVTVSLKQKGMAAHQAVGADDWVDVSANKFVQSGDVRVEIVSVQIGPVDLKRKSSVAPSPERYLAIRVRASYEGVIFQQTPYQPWTDRADSPSKHSPTLSDNHGHTYVQKTFDPGWKVVGRADVDALNPGHQVKDVLVFPVPARDVEHLRLMLPASAFGLAGEFRFQIPRSMIRGL
ncbi:MAG: hypothetical protein ACRELG_12545, partial [Gemmataceae bacterium]